MYLKEIEILGFKSFADRINIDLDDNITCVVGPNGSGKSNIVDAIRWVLGEQSVKSLRGENLMSDIIFSGSKTRNPLNVASVSLTFDNSDHYLNLPYNNVSIKRRLYRNGENEYFLNGEKCRLKDITELFLDTGVGKSSFNIISQGEISRILSSSAHERRLVIEEAAGILKYKTRREEALRKLDKTMNNIERVNDIIGELETRVEPLREQSMKAKTYLEVKDKLKQVEVGLLVKEISDINENYQINKDKIKTLEESILKLNTKINTSEVEKLKARSLELEKENAILNNKLITLTKEEEKLNGKRIIIKERSKYDATDLKVHENIIYLKENSFKLSNEIKLLENDLANIKKDLVVSQEIINNLSKSLIELKTKKDTLYREYNNKNKDYLENKNRINIVKDNLENNSTISSNVKRILNNPRLSGIYDAFGNILNIDSKYSKALEVITVSNRNFIIVDNPNDAKEAINFLKNNNLGRATFFPLSVIKPKGVDYETIDILEKDIDYLGILSDFVKYNDKYRNIVLNQLGNIILVRDIDAGNRISKLINNRYRIVTLDGEVIHVGGSITGGSINVTVSPISLKNELNDLILKNNSYEMLLMDLNKEMDSLDKQILEIEEKGYQEKSNNIRLTELFNSNNTIFNNKSNELEQVKMELSNLDHLEDNSLLKEEEKITKLYYAKKEEKELVSKEIERLVKVYQEVKDNILNLEATDRMNNSDLKNKEKELKELEIEVSKMDFKLDSNLNILNSEYELTYEKAKEEYYLEMDITEARRDVGKYKNQLKEIGMVNILSIEEFEEVNQRYEFLTNQRNDLFNAKETLYSIIDEMDQVMQEDFLKTFKELEVEFKNVFRELFKGGNATLKLTDPTNILETGVDIIASPPGKSLKAISLLSGGEKTLTAISLLFAILNIRKVPFCIFDEVEAALDESNVDVFGHYLDNYKNKTQFLLITHKKRTMEYAKTLYGITMQESGVSKLVSVKLENSN